MLQSQFVKFFQSDLGEIIKILSLIATALISITALIVNSISLNRTTYINQITTLKEKYIENLRQQISDYASLALECHKATILEDYKTEIERNQIIRDLDMKCILLVLFLNNTNPIDEKLVRYTNEIRRAAVSKGDDGIMIEPTIKRMINYSQQVLLFEWRNLKREAVKGPMSPKQIDVARSNFVNNNKDL